MSLFVLLFLKPYSISINQSIAEMKLFSDTAPVKDMKHTKTSKIIF